MIHSLARGARCVASRLVPASSSRCAFMCSGRVSAVYAMGKSSKGQLGLGSQTKETVPTLIDAFPESVVDVALGKDHALAVTASGAVYAWGDVDNGKLGVDTMKNLTTPSRVEGLDGVKIVSVAAGKDHSLALSEDGVVFSWGWGGSMLGGCGALGHGSKDPVDFPEAIKMGSDGIRVVQIGAGAMHSACLTDDGVMYTWGVGDLGRLGHGGNSDQLAPKEVDAFSGLPIRSFACGTATCAAVTTEGQLFTWGRNRWGELGQEALSVFSQESEPWLVDDLQEDYISTVACGEHHTACLTESGVFYLWGSAGFTSYKPREIKELSKPALESQIVGISCGNGFTGAVSDAGELWLWGKARKGQTGTSDGSLLGTSMQVEPKRLDLADGMQVHKVVCGHSMSLVVAS